jgi:hypothetical protein
MSRFEDLSIGHRIALTVFIVLAILFALALFGYLTGGWDNEAGAQPVYVVTKYEPRLLELERKAIEDAFTQKITSLFIVWMSDERGQPARAITGATQARKAFIASMTEIDRREADLRK